MMLLNDDKLDGIKHKWKKVGYGSDFGKIFLLESIHPLHGHGSI